MPPLFPVLRRLAFAAGFLPLLACAASPVLDPAFGAAGRRLLAESGEPVRGLGSCPHADGSITVIGHRPISTSIVSLRLRPDGSLDPSYSSDGLAEFPVFTALDPGRASVACAGTGNADPADDRAMIAATSPGTNDVALMVLVDLRSGAMDADWGLGGPVQADYSGLLFPPADGTRAFPRMQVLGVHAGNGGEWLVTGRLDGHASEPSRAFIARMSPLGAVAALATPAPAGYRVLGLSASRVGADGDIRALGSLRNAGGLDSWGLLRLDGDSLAFESLPDVGVPSGFFYDVQGGRRIGGGLMVAAAIEGDSSGFGTGARMLVVREDVVREIELPQPPALEGEPVGVIGGSATGAGAGRAVFAGALRTATRSSVGYYVAMVQLGDGGSVPDTVFRTYGSDGVGTFRYRGHRPDCAVGLPYQAYAGISSWGDATLLVGESQPVCDDQNAPTRLFAARLATAANGVFADRFEP